MNLRTSLILAVCAAVSLPLASCSAPSTPKAKVEISPDRTAPSSPRQQSSATARSSVPLAHPYKDLRDLPGTVFDVTYTPETVRIDESSWRASLASVSSDGNVFVFDHPDAKVSSLHEGSTMFLENLAVRLVLATATENGHLVVNTGRAGLTDLIQNGRIRWKVPVSFAAEQAHYQLPATRNETFFRAALVRLNPEQTAYAAGTAINLSGKLDGWDYKIDATPGSNRLDMFFAVHKELDSLI
jgi:hypothetical protein